LKEASRVLHEEVRATAVSEGLSTVSSVGGTDRRQSETEMQSLPLNRPPAAIIKQRSFQETGNKEGTKSTSKAKSSSSSAANLRDHKSISSRKHTNNNSTNNTAVAVKNKKGIKQSSSLNSKRPKEYANNTEVKGELVRPPSILSNHFANEAGAFEYPGDDVVLDEGSNVELPSRIEGRNMPDKSLVLSRVFGYRADTINGNLICLSSSEIAYSVGSIVVLWSSLTGSQRFYNKHTRDVDSLACSYDGKIVASLETLFLKEDNHHVKVHIWSSEDLNMITSFEEPLKDQRLLGIYFNSTGMLLVLKGSSESFCGRIWDWKSPRKKVSTAFFVSALSTLIFFICQHLIGFAMA